MQHRTRTQRALDEAGTTTARERERKKDRKRERKRRQDAFAFCFCNRRERSRTKAKASVKTSEELSMRRRKWRHFFPIQKDKTHHRSNRPESGRRRTRRLVTFVFLHSTRQFLCSRVCISERTRKRARLSARSSALLLGRGF